MAKKWKFGEFSVTMAQSIRIDSVILERSLHGHMGQQLGMRTGEHGQSRLAIRCDYILIRNEIGDERMPPSPPSQGPKMPIAYDYGNLSWCVAV